MPAPQQVHYLRLNHNSIWAQRIYHEALSVEHSLLNVYEAKLGGHSKRSNLQPSIWNGSSAWATFVWGWRATCVYIPQQTRDQLKCLHCATKKKNNNFRLSAFTFEECLRLVPPNFCQSRLHLHPVTGKLCFLLLLLGVLVTVTFIGTRSCANDYRPSAWTHENRANRVWQRSRRP